MSEAAQKVVDIALALRKSHPCAPAIDILDLVMRGRANLWLEDLFEHMVPPAPFALFVAQALGDASPSAEWLALTGPAADEKVRTFMRRSYDQTVLLRFCRRYGLYWRPLGDEHEITSTYSRLDRGLYQ
jgi:hypothetical protein